MLAAGVAMAPAAGANPDTDAADRIAAKWEAYDVLVRSLSPAQLAAAFGDDTRAGRGKHGSSSARDARGTPITIFRILTPN